MFLFFSFCIDNLLDVESMYTRTSKNIIIPMSKAEDEDEISSGVPNQTEKSNDGHQTLLYRIAEISFTFLISHLCAIFRSVVDVREGSIKQCGV